MGDDERPLRRRRLLLALVLANFATGAFFAVLYVVHPFGMWGRLQFFDDLDWPLRLVMGMLVAGLFAVPLPTAVSGLALRALKNAFPWYALVAAGPTLCPLLIPMFVWSAPSNVIMVVAVLVFGVTANLALVVAFEAVER